MDSAYWPAFPAPGASGQSSLVLPQEAQDGRLGPLVVVGDLRALGRRRLLDRLHRLAHGRRSAVDAPLARRARSLEASRDQRDGHIAAQGLVDARAEDDLGLVVSRGANHLGGLIDLRERQV